MALRMVKKCNYKNIEKLRIALGKTIDEFASILGITKQTYLKYLEHGGWNRQMLIRFTELSVDTKYKKKNHGWYVS